MPHFLLFVFLLAAVPLTAVATPVVTWGDMKIKHTWYTIPVNWETLGHPSAGSTIDLHIVLEPHRENDLSDAVSEISNPKHPRYRAFLSKEQVDELVRPSPETVEHMYAWLAHNSILSSSISRTHADTWLTISYLPVSQASQLLGASYQLYRNIRTNETIIGTVGYSLPEVLHPHVQTVMPTTSFSSMEMTVQTPHRRSFGPAPAPIQAASGMLGTAQARQPPPESLIVVPEILRTLYGTVEYVPFGYHTGQNSLAVVGDVRPRQQDLTAFMGEYQKRDRDRATFTMQNVDGNLPNLWELPDATSNAAVQYATAMAFPTPLFVFRIERNVIAFTQLIIFLLTMPSVPHTVGISFNYFLEHHLSPHDAHTMCGLFEIFAARGVSVLVASGNDGVGAGDCHSFNAEFPSSCPWVTSVGGTQGRYPEVATPRSGGGFSYYFERPIYQQYVVPVFFYEADYPYYLDHLFNIDGRGYPDISAQAYGCRIFLNGNPDVAWGTACAVSTAAGIISLLNDYMIGSRPASENPDSAALGFLNPWLYSEEVRIHKGLNDIVQGSNPGCNTAGFEARPGWDPVTGLGTLNFPVLLYLVKEIRFNRLVPTPVPTPS